MMEKPRRARNRRLSDRERWRNLCDALAEDALGVKVAPEPNQPVPEEIPTLHISGTLSDSGFVPSRAPEPQEYLRLLELVKRAQARAEPKKKTQVWPLRVPELVEETNVKPTRSKASSKKESSQKPPKRRDS
jgi:hypothetical protein